MDYVQRMITGSTVVFLAAYLTGRVVDVAGGSTTASLWRGMAAAVVVGGVLGVLTMWWASRADRGNR